MLDLCQVSVNKKNEFLYKVKLAYTPLKSKCSYYSMVPQLLVLPK